MLLKLISTLSIGLGLFFLIQIITPLAAYYAWEKFSYADQSLVSPTGQKNVLGVAVKDEGFVSQNISDQHPKISEFTITVPALKLLETKVIANSNDFDANLAQLPQTALPGEIGNVFITGHSSTPVFPFGQKKETYFKNLNQLKKEDQILVIAGGKSYQYIVLGMKIVDPQDTSVINSPDVDGKYLTLMTCVPPGFNTKRLVVLAKQVN